MCDYLPLRKGKRKQKTRKYLQRDMEILIKQDSQHRALKEWHL